MNQNKKNFSKNFYNPSYCSNCDVSVKKMKIYILLVCHNQYIKNFQSRYLFWTYRTYCRHAIMMTNLSAVLEFFKNRALAKLFNKYSWCYFHLKILSSIPANRNLSIDLFYKINWLVSICDDIFRESLLRNSYSCRQSSQLLWQHPSVYFELFFKEFGWTILSN